MSDDFAVAGRIADRWQWWGGSGGAFGRPVAAAETVPGRAGARQRFERGEIAWSPDQDIVSSVYLLRNEACFEWSRPGFDFDFFRYDIERDGAGLGQAALKVPVDDLLPEDEVLRWTRLQGFAEYTFVVKSCTDPLIGSESDHGWTIPVRLQFAGLGPSPYETLPAPQTPDPPVTGLIADRWHELGAWDGPLGRPSSAMLSFPDIGMVSQQFAHGVIQTLPAEGPLAVIACYQRLLPPPGSEQASPSIELNWGPSDSHYNAFRVDLFQDGVQVVMGEGPDAKPFSDLILPPVAGFWADSLAGSGQGQLINPIAYLPQPPVSPSPSYFVEVRVFATVADPDDDDPKFPEQPMARLPFNFVPPDLSAIPLEFPALDGSPEAAFASHRDRALSVARGYAATRPLRVTFHTPSKSQPASNENDGVRLMAHFAAAAEEPDFCPPGELPSLVLAHIHLRQMRLGRIGTKIDQTTVGPVSWGRQGDYDAALRGFLVVACRYWQLLTDSEIGFILHRLVPPGLSDGHNPDMETIEIDVHEDATLPFGLDAILDLVVGIPGLDAAAIALLTAITPDALVTLLEGAIPESENHILMIESGRYLINQLFLDRTADQRYNNTSNGLTAWLAGRLQTIAQHDFMEFGARVYTRYSLHALLNLHEFARDDNIRILAQNILDYTTVKFAVSSSRLRRVNPYRRLLTNANRPPYTEKDGVSRNFTFDDLRSSETDPMTGFGLTYLGDHDRAGRPRATYPDNWAFHCILAGSAAYRPPHQAYTLAMSSTYPPTQHTFYHGVRPKVTGTDDVADAGVEIYYKSPSFLISAGGMYLNSGYGRDDNVFANYKNTATPQSTTLIATRADLNFQDLIRFDPYPLFPTPADPPALTDQRYEAETTAVNTGVDMGFACGANLRIPPAWYDLAGAVHDGPWTFLDLNRADLGPLHPADPNAEPLGPLGLWVAAYKTPPILDEFPLPDPPGSPPGPFIPPPPDSYGLLYAVEAAVPGGLPSPTFEQFMATIRSSNPDLPSQFSRTGTYTFRTGDGKSFVWHMSTEGSKYSARVIQRNGADLDDFVEYPLVLGNYMQAPGLHDGQIVISVPSATPVPNAILDSRDAAQPSNSNNLSDYPQVWQARTVALTQAADQDLADGIVAAGKQTPDGDKAAVRAARAAVGTLRGFTPPPDETAVYLSWVTRALLDLVGRLMTVGRIDEVIDVVPDAIAAHLQAASAAGADTFTIAATANTMSAWMDDNAAIPGLTADRQSRFHELATECEQAASEIMDAGQPIPGHEAPYFLFAAQLDQGLVVRLTSAGHPDAVPPVAAKAIAAYQRAAAIPEANRQEISDELGHLSFRLDQLGLTDLAAAASTAAAEVLTQ